jgi:hypothetical protein
MPACIQLIDKVTGEPEVFATIDNKLCAHLNVEPHPVRFYAGWYDCVCLLLSMGKTYAEVRTIYHDCPDILSVLDFLEPRYTPSAWYERKV